MLIWVFQHAKLARCDTEQLLSVASYPKSLVLYMLGYSGCLLITVAGYYLVSAKSRQAALVFGEEGVFVCVGGQSSWGKRNLTAKART